MARTDSKTQLEALRKKQLELVKKIKEAEGKSKKAEHEKQQRRHSLAGALALKEFEANPSGDFARALLALLHHGVTKPADRALFNLPALPNESKPEGAPQPSPARFMVADGGVTGVGGG